MKRATSNVDKGLAALDIVGSIAPFIKMGRVGNGIPVEELIGGGTDALGVADSFGAKDGLKSGPTIGGERNKNQ